jgi:hypothetical protein
VLAVDIFVIVDAGRNRGRYENALSQTYGSSSYIAYMFFLVLFAAYMIVAMSLLGNLLFFHVKLISRGMTTYQWILNRREKKRARGEQVAKDTECCQVSRRRDFKKRGNREPVEAEEVRGSTEETEAAVS